MSVSKEAYGPMSYKAHAISASVSVIESDTKERDLAVVIKARSFTMVSSVTEDLCASGVFRIVKLFIPVDLGVTATEYLNTHVEMILLSISVLFVHEKNKLYCNMFIFTVPLSSYFLNGLW